MVRIKYLFKHESDKRKGEVKQKVAGYPRKEVKDSKPLFLSEREKERIKKKEEKELEKTRGMFHTEKIMPDLGIKEENLTEQDRLVLEVLNRRRELKLLEIIKDSSSVDEMRKMVETYCEKYKEDATAINLYSDYTQFCREAGGSERFFVILHFFLQEQEKKQEKNEIMTAEEKESPIIKEDSKGEIKDEIRQEIELENTETGRQELVRFYNSYDDTLDKNKLWSEKYNPVEFEVINSMARRRGKEIPPDFERYVDGNYNLILVEEGLAWVVPRYEFILQRSSFGPGAMGLFFDCPNYDYEKRYEVKIEKPAIFEYVPDENDSNKWKWELKEKGELRLSDRDKK